MTEIVLTGRNVHALPVWGWEIAVYLFLGGVTAGIMIVSGLIARRIPIEKRSRWMRYMPLLAPVVLSLGMTALLFDLESKLHIFRFYTAFRITSPMSWGAWILLLIYPAALMLGMANLTVTETARLPKLIRRIAQHARGCTVRIERANILLGIALGTYTGILLAMLSARALWGSAILGPLFLVSGLSTGAALIMLFPISQEEHEAVRRLDLIAIASELILLALFLAHLAAGGLRGRLAADLLLGGAWSASFWTIVVIAGLLVPLTLELSEKHLHLKPTAATSILLLSGGFMLRWIFVAAGQAV